ncbi:hypothetical protein SKAU_G00202690 [Synaphobranchus kaupii]|uniref:G-protein coupled receptors family 1 profile domain-containing protein n=1 Tax=Synaphobranchus kaupii TaxID=118154 RepID=A0A9Q1IYJ1_SYNKA|nr:hypothetical protein SKAU_G00202690 [Synaphobranchus kaupii]
MLCKVGVFGQALDRYRPNGLGATNERRACPGILNVKAVSAGRSWRTCVPQAEEIPSRLRTEAMAPSSVLTLFLLALLSLHLDPVQSESVADPAPTPDRDGQDTSSGGGAYDVTTKDPFHDLTDNAFTLEYEDATRFQAVDEDIEVLGPGAITAIVIAVFLGASVLLALVVILLRKFSKAEEESLDGPLGQDHTCWNTGVYVTATPGGHLPRQHDSKICGEIHHSVSTLLSLSVKMSKCNLTDTDNLMDSLRLVIYIPIFVFGLILNTTALVVFCFQLKKWTESTIYMTNLALMDQLLVFSLPFRMYNSKWAADKRVFCSFLESLYFVSIYGSIYTITCISLDRYVGVSHPFRAKQLRSPRKALLVCAAIWALVFGATAPVYGFHPGDGGSFRCFHGFSDKGWNPALIGCLEVFGFLLPAAVLVACSARVVHVLRHSSRSSPKNKASVRIIYSGLVAFLVPFTPSHLAILLQFFVRRGAITDCRLQADISMFVQMAMNLANVTCCLDALCYYFVAKEVRTSSDSFKRSFRQWRSTITSGTPAGMDPENSTELGTTQRIMGAGEPSASVTQHKHPNQS